MPDEMSKATRRRILDWRFTNRWLVGDGLDVGCGNDLMSHKFFPRVKSVTGYDICLGHKDAQTLPEISDNSYDFVVSSHCLEHLYNPAEALRNWLRVVRPGGFVVATFPDEELYEHGEWPSRRNGDHKHGLSLRQRPYKFSLNILRMIVTERPVLDCDVELVQLLTEYYIPELKDENNNYIDQTGSKAECAIEIVLRAN